MLMQGKTAIVTGATRGIGKAILYRLAEEGAAVVGIYASSDQLAEEIEADLQAKGAEIAFYKGSITDQSFVRTFMQEVVAKHGSIDVLVNNAGVVADSFISQMALEDWQHVFHTNYEGTYRCSIEALPHMQRQGSGKIVNVISVTGVLGREAQSNYGASKGAIIGLTRLMAREYASEGIYVNAIAPGMINTEMIGHVPQNKLENFLKHTDMRRLGEPVEVADSVLFLCSKMSDYVAGTVLKSDGGFIR